MSTPAKILFMDDEPTQTVVVNALSRLRDEGYEIDFFDTMSAAIDAYYQQYYDVFILDIDMHHRPDTAAGDGVKLLQRFVSLYNKTRVILFSGAGTVTHWFAAANAHCFGYVAKDEEGEAGSSVGVLLDKVRQAVELRDGIDPGLTVTRYPETGLIVCGDAALAEQAMAQLRSALPASFRLEHLQPDTFMESQADTGRYAFRVLIQPEFSTRQRQLAQIDRMMAGQPYPHSIVVCNAEDSNRLRKSILYVANAHPFRMIDLLGPRWLQDLQQAVSAALLWHGRREIFEAESDALAGLTVSLPEGILDSWQDELPADLQQELEHQLDELNAATDATGEYSA